MKNKQLHIACFIALILFSACEKEAVIEIRESGKQMVINGLFNQTTPLQVSITESISPYDENVVVKDLTRSGVALYENAVFIEFMAYRKEPDETLGKFFSTLIPAQGNNYRIEVTDSVFGLVSATSRMPSYVNIGASKSNWTPWGEDTLSVIRFNFEFELDDPPEKNNYYLTIGCPLLKPDDATGKYEIFDIQYAEIYSADIASPLLYLKNGWLFTDVNFNGTKYIISGTATMNTNPCCNDYDEEVIIDKKELYVFLENLSTEAHDFHTSYAHRLITQNDFYAEPGFVYSNVHNGMGIFGGSSLTEIHIPIDYQ